MMDVLFMLPPLAIVAVFGFLIWRARRPAVWHDVAPDPRLQPDSDGALIVPVRQLRRFGTFSSASNSLSPKLWIGQAGLRVKIFKLQDYPFAEMRLIDVRRPLLGGVAIIVKGQGFNQALIATVADPATARAALRALPPGLPFTPAAAALRGENGRR